MLNDSPVFLLSSERSGTNLLRKLITEHQDIYFGPSPAHFLKHLYYREPYYNDLNEDINFKVMIKDALDLIYIHFSPWSIKLNCDTVLELYNNKNFKKRNAVLLSHFLMTLYAQEQGYETYFCKDNSLYEFAFEILNNLPNAKFIYLHRDPRDFAVSQFLRSVETDSLVRISNLWAYEQVKCISVYKSLEKNQIMKLSYEEILDDSMLTVNNICKFLGVEFLTEEKEVEIYTGKSEEWSNLDKPIMKNNSKKYLKIFTKKQISNIESITKQQLLVLGYQLECKSNEMSLLEKLLDIFYGELRFRIRNRFIQNKDDFNWTVKRNKLLNRLSVRWHKKIV